MSNTNTPAPWMTDEQLDDLNEWDECAPGEGDHFRVWKRGATEIRNAAAAHYEPLLAEKEELIVSQRKDINNAWDGNEILIRQNTDLLHQLTAKDKEVEELKRLADLDCDQLESWKIEGMKLENATLRAEVERLKGENEALKMHPGTLKDQAWIQMLEDLKADVTGFAEWICKGAYFFVQSVEDEKLVCWWLPRDYKSHDEKLTTSELYQEYRKQCTK